MAGIFLYHQSKFFWTNAVHIHPKNPQDYFFNYCDYKVYWRIEAPCSLNLMNKKYCIRNCKIGDGQLVIVHAKTGIMRHHNRFVCCKKNLLQVFHSNISKFRDHIQLWKNQELCRMTVNESVGWLQIRQHADAPNKRIAWKSLIIVQFNHKANNHHGPSYDHTAAALNISDDKEIVFQPLVCV